MTQDARERAWPSLTKIREGYPDKFAEQWESWRDDNGGIMSLPEATWLGWLARGLEDEQRIAALVEAVIWMSGSADFAPGGQAHEHWVGIRDGVLARALAGSEESGDDEQRSDAASL